MEWRALFPLALVRPPVHPHTNRTVLFVTPIVPSKMDSGFSVSYLLTLSFFVTLETEGWVSYWIFHPVFNHLNTRRERAAYL